MKLLNTFSSVFMLIFLENKIDCIVAAKFSYNQMPFWDQSPADWHKKHLASCQDWFGSVETGSNNRMEEGGNYTRQ